MCRNLIYFKHFFVFVFVSGCVSFSAFASLIGVPVGIASSAVDIAICATTAGVKKHKSVQEKEEKA